MPALYALLYHPEPEFFPLQAQTPHLNLPHVNLHLITNVSKKDSSPVTNVNNELSKSSKICKKNLKTLKIVSEASVGTIFIWSCALWSPDPPLQGGIKNFARFQNSGSNQYDNVKVNVYCQCLLYLWRKKVCLIKSCSLFTNTGGILVRVWPIQGPFIGALLYEG